MPASSVARLMIFFSIFFGQPFASHVDLGCHSDGPFGVGELFRHSKVRQHGSFLSVAGGTSLSVAGGTSCAGRLAHTRNVKRCNSLQRAVRTTGTSCLVGLACEERQGILAKFMN